MESPFTFLGHYIDPETNKIINVKETFEGIEKVGGSKIEIKIGFLEDEKGQILEKVAIKRFTVSSLQLEKHSYNEFSIMEKLKHPNIVKLYKNLERRLSNKQTLISIVMEICECDLADYVCSRTLNESDIRQLFIQMIKGLSYLHSKKILHRDIKPPNFLLKGDVIKLADYGISKETNEEDITKNTANIGTPGYAAPEVLVEKVNEIGHYSYPADIFSLGVTLYFMYAKASPWNLKYNDPSLIKNHYKERLAMKEKIFDGIPVKMSEEVKDLILRMLCYDKNERITLSEIENIIKFTEFFEKKIDDIGALQKSMQTIYDFHHFCPDVTLYNQVLLLLCYEIHNKISELYWIVKNQKKPDWFKFFEWKTFYETFQAKKLRMKLKVMTKNAKKNLQLLEKKTSKIALVDFSFGKSQMRSKIEKLLEVYQKRYEEILKDPEMVLMMSCLKNLVKEIEFSIKEI